MNSLFTDLPTTLTEEVVTVLAENQHVRIDRIVGGCSAISANWAMLTVVKKANRLWGVWKRMVWADQYFRPSSTCRVWGASGLDPQPGPQAS